MAGRLGPRPLARIDARQDTHAERHLSTCKACAAVLRAWHVCLFYDEESRLVEAGRKVGHTFPQPDLIIAATAWHHGLSVVTRDTGGHEKTAVPLVNPWMA